MAGMSGGSMLRTRRKDVNVKPNRKLDRKSSRGMLYENEELRLRTININAEVERGQTDIKKLKRENEQLRREISALRYEYEHLDQLLQERRSSPEHSDDSASCCSACHECADSACAQNDQNATCAARAAGGGGGATDAGGGAAGPSGGLHVAFQDLSSVPEEDAAGADAKSQDSAECSCDSCLEKDKQPNMFAKEPLRDPIPRSSSGMDRGVDVLVHDEPPTAYLTSAVPFPQPPGFRHPQNQGFTAQEPPPPGFNMNALAQYNPPPRFHTGGNVEDLLGDVQTGPHIITTEYIQQNSVFMCNTRKITQRREPCCCQKQEKTTNQNENGQTEREPKYYVTEKNIELTYDYPKTTAIPQRSPSPMTAEVHTTTEVASTVVFVERKIPIKPRGKLDFLFRSRSAPVGESEEPIYATVKKLPKRLRRIELAKLENEVAYRTSDSIEMAEDTERPEEPDVVLCNQADDDTSRSEEKPPPTPRPDTPKAKKRRRFSFTFKKRSEKNKSGKENAANGGQPPVIVEGDSERLLEGEQVGITNGVQARHPKRCRHRPRTTASSISSGPRYKRDSYQEMTSHSEHERTNSISSSINSNSSLATHKSRKLSAPPPDTTIPWCGCWGTSCL